MIVPHKPCADHPQGADSTCQACNGVDASTQLTADRCRERLDSPPDRVRRWHSKLGHAIEDATGEPHLDDLSVHVTGTPPITKHQLLAHERVLGANLLVVARLLVPRKSPDLANASNDSISQSTSATSGLRGLDQ